MRLIEPRPVTVSSGQGVVGVDAIAKKGEFFQRGFLSGEVVGGTAGFADCDRRHRAVYDQRLPK